MQIPLYSRLLFLLLLSCIHVFPQSSDAPLQAAIAASPVSGREAASDNALFTDARDYFGTGKQNQQRSFSKLPWDVLQDEKRIFPSPAHFRRSDLRWMLPLAATTGLLIGTDHHVMTLIHSNAVNRDRSALVSDASLAAFAGVTAGLYGIGAWTHNEHMRETGLLSAEALADSFFAVEAIKILTSRQRPDTNSSRGLFEHVSPFNSSFPSEHSALAWTAATVIAQEYPGQLTRWSAYGLASLVSLSRVTAERHFPSDVLIGAAAGYLIGRYVYRTHHNDRLTDRVGATPTADIRVPGLSALVRASRRPRPDSGSPYVPLDSWIYPALKRLASLGFIPSQPSNLAPWTRAECLSQVEEAEVLASRHESGTKRPYLSEEALRLLSDLKTELLRDAGVGHIAHLESLYTRVTGISGAPLRDSYHFGQTLFNDYGRPYGEGINNITGFSSYATSGPFFAYFRGEYQYAPGRDADPLNVREFVAAADGTPLQPSKSVTSTSGFQTQEMYAGVRLGFENITFGKQNLWWGPGEESAFSFSTNAQPFYTLRLSQARALTLPGPFSHLGKIRTDIVFGKLSGHQWPARPYMNAQKISLDVTDNFEVGFTRSSFFGGVGHPLTFGNLAASFVSTSSTGGNIYGSRNDPGDRHSGFDFRYRVPGLRQYLTIYSDSYADDDPSPLDNPRRSAWAPGLYLSQIPRLKKLDLRFETYSTLLYAQDFGGKFIYWNGQYRDSYTNNRYLLGSWIGRDARAYTASSTYWFSARSTVKAQFRQVKAGVGFIPGGGTQTDIGLTGQWGLSPQWMITSKANYERYYIPLLGAPRTDFLCALQIAFTPSWGR